MTRLAELHIWTPESVQADRLDFRPRHRLTVLVVQAIPLVEPVRLLRTPEYAGCVSWVDVPLRPRWATPSATTKRSSNSPSGFVAQWADGGCVPVGRSRREIPPSP